MKRFLIVPVVMALAGCVTVFDTGYSALGGNAPRSRKEFDVEATVTIRDGSRTIVAKRYLVMESHMSNAGRFDMPEGKRVMALEGLILPIQIDERDVASVDMKARPDQPFDGTVQRTGFITGGYRIVHGQDGVVRCERLSADRTLLAITIDLKRLPPIIGSRPNDFDNFHISYTNGLFPPNLQECLEWQRAGAWHVETLNDNEPK